MTEPASSRHSAPADPGVEGTVARPGGISYLRIPARDVAESAEFYRAVFGWEIRGGPGHLSFSDGTGHVIGHWRTDLPVTGEAGVRPYVYVTRIDEVLRAAQAHGGQLVTPPYPEGSLTVAVVRDPAGNFIGVWQS
ncbi:MAG TPA: VOC family protein [Trebonia sp.]|nr:VOC family protein [Trebonia sp.]